MCVGVASQECLSDCTWFPSQTNNECPGGVSNVDMDGNNILQIKAIGVVISIFEALPNMATSHIK
jgi:hypothetical protein